MRGYGQEDTGMLPLWVPLALGGMSAASNAYGSYQQGKAADKDRALTQKQWEAEFARGGQLNAEDKRRWDWMWANQLNQQAEDTRRYDQDFGEDTRRWGLNFGEDTRRYDQDFGENQRQFNVGQALREAQFGEDTRRWDLSRSDTRGDIEYERDLMGKKGRAVSPFVGRLLKLGA